MFEDYVQPIAQHVAHAERLLLRGADDDWFLWTGEQPGSAPVEVSAATAAWLLRQPRLLLLPVPRFWVHPADLPLAPVGIRSEQPGYAAEDVTAS